MGKTGKTKIHTGITIAARTDRDYDSVLCVVMAFIDVLFTIIFKGEYVYWIVYGPELDLSASFDFNIFGYRYNCGINNCSHKILGYTFALLFSVSAI